MISPRNSKFTNPYASPNQINPSRLSPQMNNLRPSPNHYQLSKRIQHEDIESTIRKMEPVVKSTSKDHQFQRVSSNVYQINQNNHFQHKTNITNIHNYQAEPIMRPTSILYPHEHINNYQSYQGDYAKPQQPIVRPNSKIFSPQHCVPQQQPFYATSGNR